jgi:hypothetical protein
MAEYPIKPLRGLWRDQNQLLNPPGSMSVARNMVIRRQGVLEPIHGSEDLDLEGTVSHTNEPVAVMDAGGGYLIYVEESGGSHTTRWYNAGAKTQILNADSNSDQYETGREHLMRYRDDRWYLTTTGGVVVLDSQADTTSRKAGLQPPTLALTLSTSGTVRAVADTKYVAYRTTLVREMTDGTFVESAPSSPAFIKNGAGATRNVSVSCSLHPSLTAIAGDKVRVYRTVAFATKEVDDYMRLAVEQEIDSTDISNGYVTVLDANTDDDLSGEELYTNAGQKGLLKAHYPPPQARDIAWFKGSAWVIASRERHSFDFRIPAQWGTLDSTNLANGIGIRSITGDTNSNTTLDNVSDMTGIVVGQTITGTDIAAGTTVAALPGGSVITLSQAATGTTGGGSFTIKDVLEVDGTDIDMGNPKGMLLELDSNSIDVQVQLSLPYDGATDNELIVGFEASLSRHYPESTGNPITLRATNGANYSPALPEIGETVVNSDAAERFTRLAYSEPNQPEHWPLVNRLEIGQGEIVRIVPAGDVMYVFDGGARKIYAVTGTGGDDWRSDLVAEDVLLVSPHAVVSYGGTVYFWGDAGLMALRGGQLVNLSGGRLSDYFKDAFDALVSSWGETYNWTRDGQMAFDAFHGELWLTTAEGGDPLLYNVQTDEFYEYTNPSGDASSVRLPVYSADELLMYYSYLNSGTYYPRRFLAWTSTSRETGTFTLNRLDLGEPGILKKWREIVWLYAPSAAVTPTMSMTTVCDAQTGGASVQQTVSRAVDASDPTEAVTHVPRNCGMSNQLQIKMQSDGSVYWALEGIVVRAEALVDRTGART